MSVSTDTAQKLAELFWNFQGYVGELINNFEILYSYTFIGFEVGTIDANVVVKKDDCTEMIWKWRRMKHTCFNIGFKIYLKRTKEIYGPNRGSSTSAKQ